MKLREKIRGLEKAVNTLVIGREELTRAIMLAFLSRNHVMMIGPPGIAKSFAAHKVFERVDEAATFFTQLHNEASAESVFGPIDMQAYREERCLRHNTEGTIVDADLAFLDEFMDAPWSVRRSLLEILFERNFSKGSHNESVPLWSCIATTNFDKADTRDDAVFDRFMFRVRVSGLGMSDKLELLSRYVDGEPEVEDCSVNLQEIRSAFYFEISKVSISFNMLEYIHILVKDFIASCGKAAGMIPSDRRIVSILPILRASAWLDGRDSVEIEDLEAMRYGLIVIGESAQEKIFAEAYASTIGQLIAERSRQKDIEQVDRLIHREAKSVFRTFDEYSAYRLLYFVEYYIAALTLEHDTGASYSKVESCHANLNDHPRVAAMPRRDSDESVKTSSVHDSVVSRITKAEKLLNRLKNKIELELDLEVDVT